MKSLRVHYMNKYPGCQIMASDSSFQVYLNGALKVSLMKNGAGQWLCNSKEVGADDCHDLSPLPKDCRFMKLYKDGSVGRAEEYAERHPKALAMAKDHGGKVPGAKA